MTIDWTKPLELEDGTPVVIAPGNGPDPAGDYGLRRADGDLFTFAQTGDAGFRTAYWKPNGARWGGFDGSEGEYGMRVRNVAEDTSDTPPQWAVDRAYELVGEGYAYTAFARYIAEHEQPPVDPDLLTAREICARVADQIAFNDECSTEYCEGKYDTAPEMQFVLSKLKEARGQK